MILSAQDNAGNKISLTGFVGLTVNHQQLNKNASVALHDSAYLEASTSEVPFLYVGLGLKKVIHNNVSFESNLTGFQLIPTVMMHVGQTYQSNLYYNTGSYGSSYIFVQSLNGLSVSLSNQISVAGNVGLGYKFVWSEMNVDPTSDFAEVSNSLKGLFEGFSTSYGVSATFSRKNVEISMRYQRSFDSETNAITFRSKQYYMPVQYSFLSITVGYRFYH